MKRSGSRRSHALVLFALLFALLGASGCNQIFGLNDSVELNRPNTRFAGCFTGNVTDPPSTATVTLVLEAPEDATVSLIGCMQGTAPLAFTAMLTGATLEDESRAQLTVMPQGLAAFAVLAEREPAERFAEAVTVTLITQSGGSPIRRIDDMQRCTQTCEDLGIAQSFAPEGTP